MTRRHTVRSPRELKALQSPVRHQLIAVLEREGPLTVREAAEHMDRSAESLYHHVRILLEAGLLLDRGKRPGKRRPETVYELVARTVSADPDETSPAFLDALARTHESMLRHASRLLGSVERAGAGRRAGPYRDTVAHQHNVRLSKQSLKELNRRLEAVRQFLVEHEDEDADDFYTVTYVLSPNRWE